MMRAGLSRAILAVCFMFSAAVRGSAEDACEREMVRAAQNYGVPLGVLYAVGLAETGRAGSLQPYALNVEGKPVYAASRGEALHAVAQARLAGARMIDIGCMQINHHFHGRMFNSIEDMLEPSRNVDYAARFLKQLRAREGSWTLAVARYHAGPDNDPAQKEYVCRVIANLAAVGFGEWTPDAHAFCRP
jgi:soluble lytic murein transglycosylase-like protein